MEKYQVDKKIGSGTYGSAYLVHLKEMKHIQYVLKMIRVDNISPKERAAAHQEVKLLSQLDHPFVLGYTESFMYKNCLCIVTEYCESGDLYQYIKRQKQVLPERQILEWFVEMALAIDYVHGRGVLHRDLKSQNIFLTREGHVKLGDFGIARVLNSPMEMAQTVIGTPYYMSPEIMQSKPYDFKSDIWALGCILYEITTLKHAFDAQDMNGLVMKILRGKILPINPAYSDDLRTLIGKMLHKNPRSRPPMDQILSATCLQPVLEVVRSKAVQIKRQRVIMSGAAARTSRGSSAAVQPGGPDSLAGSPERDAGRRGIEEHKQGIEDQLQRDYEERTSIEQKLSRLREGMRRPVGPSGAGGAAGDADPERGSAGASSSAGANHANHANHANGGGVNVNQAGRMAGREASAPPHQHHAQPPPSERPLWIRDQSVGAGLARDASEGSGEDSVGAAEERVRALRREVQAVKRAVRLREQEMGGPGQPGPPPLPAAGPSSAAAAAHRRASSVDYGADLQSDNSRHVGPARAARSSIPNMEWVPAAGSHRISDVGMASRSSLVEPDQGQLTARRLQGAASRRSLAEGLDAAYAAAVPLAPGPVPIPRGTLGRGRNQNQNQNQSQGQNHRRQTSIDSGPEAFPLIPGGAAGPLGNGAGSGQAVMGASPTLRHVPSHGYDELVAEVSYVGLSHMGGGGSRHASPLRMGGDGHCPDDHRTRRIAKKEEENRRREAELLEARRAYFEERRALEQRVRGTHEERVPGIGGTPGSLSHSHSAVPSATPSAASTLRRGLGPGAPGGVGSTHQSPTKLGQPYSGSPVQHGLSNPPLPPRPMALPPRQPRAQMPTGPSHNRQQSIDAYLDAALGFGTDSHRTGAPHDDSFGSLSSSDDERPPPTRTVRHVGPGSQAHALLAAASVPPAQPGYESRGSPVRLPSLASTQSVAAGIGGADELRKLERYHDALSDRISQLEEQVERMALSGEPIADGDPEGAAAPPGLGGSGGGAELEEDLSRPRAGDEELLSSAAFTHGSPADRSKALRDLCSRNLGPALFGRLYELLRERTAVLSADDAMSHTDDSTFRDELGARLGPQKMHYIGLIEQLLFYEELSGGGGSD